MKSSALVKSSRSGSNNAFAGILVSRLQEYEIVYPRVIPNASARNRRSTQEDRETWREYLRREPVFLEISNWTLRTVANDRLILSSNFTVNWVRQGKTKSERHNAKANCDLRQGSLEGDASSFVVVTICEEEVYALMSIGQRSFFVQPLTNGQHVMFQPKNERWRSIRDDSSFVSVNPENPAGKSNKFEVRESKRKSKRRKRDSLSHDVQGFYNLSGDVFDVEYPEAEKLILYDEKDDVPAEYNDTIVEELSIDVNPEEIGYFSGPKWQRNRLSKKRPAARDSPPRWLELGIAADYSVVDFHGIRVQQYILALLNIVSAIYMDPSLESNMILVIVRMILYAEKRDGMVRRGDARRSLENVNKWNRKMLSSKDVNHDVAVWLTRLDIGGPSGYAPVSGVCDPARSCALNRDEGLTSAFIIAHEVAHILGLTHDGDETTGNACKEEGSRGSVMAPMVAATFHHFYWSACSKKEFHRRVRRWSCLSNKPKHDGLSQLRDTIRETFTMDEQCRMEFGEGYEHCKTFDVAEPCSRLWCGNSNVSESCKTKKGPPLEGTLCGDSKICRREDAQDAEITINNNGTVKWCINGRCQSTNRKSFDFGIILNKPRDGGWSAWSGWEKCSRTCGVGVQCRTRKCNKPLPAYGGKYCSGASDDCRLCDLPKCLTPVDLRAQQCTKLGNILYLERVRSNNDVTWLPYVSDQENLRCRLICKSKETGEIFHTRKHLIDGTPCTYGSTNICIQGECHRMGCDRVLGSKKALDTCGVCDGDNSSCENIVNKFQRKLRREVTRVAVIPRDAHNLNMNISMAGSRLFQSDDLTIVIGDGRRRRNVQENLASRKRDLTIVQGAAFRVQRRGNNTYFIQADGTAFEDVVVLVVVPRNVLQRGISTSVSLEYSLNRDERNAKDRYVWLFGGWSFCSVSCGGGTRQKMIVCKDEETGRIVSRRKCPLTTKPIQEIEKCNVFSCTFKWLPGPWEACSTTCGRFGMQLRQLYCVRSGFNGTEVNRNNELEVYRTMVQPSICETSPMPMSSRECNRIPCPGHWIFTNWSSCSKNNGKDIQSRIGRCIPPENESFYRCDGPTVKTEIRSCTEHVTRAIEFPSRCWRDKNRFCSIPSLKRYCDVPAFKRKCCRSCERNETLDLSNSFDRKHRILQT
ncbi:A disintegrin and metalloproteinase with thrombospondin motifs 18-like isoform X2 [Bombus huntii]|uniref:A disintegrin and metalloproteinase with thrombospondin motifs 18-like isoform X2 n=1 Tax=Bombus huntii TaxID=85661 RepID=UPI0021AB044A|nr:A disintegrin and metalloproteinase with thrombospondin motifs 18-like isoform X2 [Bombus huntii]